MRVESLLVPTDLESTGVGDLPAFAAVSTVAWVVAGVLWIRVVRAVAADQEELLRHLHKVVEQDVEAYQRENAK